MPGVELFEQLQPFTRDAVVEGGEPGGVSTRSRKTVDDAGTERVGDLGEHDWYRLGRLKQRSNCRAAGRNEDIRCKAHQLGGRLTKVGNEASSPTDVDADVPPFDPARRTEGLYEGANTRLRLRVAFSEPGQYADAPHPLASLRARREWP